MADPLFVVNPSLKAGVPRSKFKQFSRKDRRDLIVILGAASFLSFVSFFIFTVFIYKELAQSISFGIFLFLAFVTASFTLLSKPSKQILRLEYKGRFGELFYTLVKDLKTVQNDCKTFRIEAATDTFLEESISRIETAANRLEWDIASYFVKVNPYIAKGTKVTTGRIEENFKDYTLQVREFENILKNLTDAAFKYSVTETAQNHLKIIQTDIQVMIDALEEIYQHQNQAALPAAPVKESKINAKDFYAVSKQSVETAKAYDGKD